MKILKFKTLVKYKREYMFSLVNDVEKYYLFFPNCIYSKIIRKQKNALVAKLIISKFGFTQTIITYNLINHNNSIKINLIKGPFKKFFGMWTFTRVKENTSLVKLHIHFQIENNILNKMFYDNYLNKNIKNIISAFIKRAEFLYNQK